MVFTSLLLSLLISGALVSAQGSPEPGLDVSMAVISDPHYYDPGLGVQTVFTGHFHADDITLHEWNDGSFLFDIETGSLITYPCPIRKITIRGDSMFINTEHILTIPSMEKGLQEYARMSVSQGASKLASKTMMNWKLNQEDANYLAFQLGTLFSEHCQGDEAARNPAVRVDGVSIWGRLMILFRKGFIRGLANDLPPADNNLTIHLQTGEYH